MLEHSEPRLNHQAFLGYYLQTRVESWPHDRTSDADALQRSVDMDVSGMGPAQGRGPIRPAIPAGASTPSTSSGDSHPPTSTNDNLQISPAGKMRDRMNESPENRAERLAQIKEAIDNGEYDSDEKLEAALERMFEIHGFDLGDE